MNKPKVLITTLLRVLFLFLVFNVLIICIFPDNSYMNPSDELKKLEKELWCRDK